MSAPAETAPHRARRRLILLPLLLFAGLAAIFFVRLHTDDPSRIPSALIGREAPDVELPAIEGLGGPGGPTPSFSRADLLGHVGVVNVWASWCVPCRDEHPILSEIAEDERVMLAGINYKDDPANARRFLGQLGNPFDAVGADRSGRASIDWGVYGVPETFILDPQGRIVHKHIGPISERQLESEIRPAIERAAAAE